MRDFAKSPLRMGLAMCAALLVSVSACDRNTILEVIDPDLVTPDNVTGEKGAELFWAGALGRFAQAYSGNGGGMIMYSGMLADEFHLSGTFPTRNEIDRREILVQNGTMLGQYRRFHRARVAAENATDILEEFLPGDPRIAEMYSLAGYTYIFFGENYCSGVPYGDTPGDGEPENGVQTTTAETFGRAIDRFNSASAATAGDMDQDFLARIGRARVLLNQGNFAAAAGEVAGIPSDWEYFVRHKDGGDTSQRNAVYDLNQNQRRWSVSDQEGGNGIAFRDTDPRTPWEESGFGFDENTVLYHQLKYPRWEDDVPLANGTEARLIEAEAQYQAADPTGMFTTLNTLRTDAGMAALTDPGTGPEQEDILFEERARWLFATAHRLGDMRRLIRQYGRNSETVFPTGPYFKGGAYGPDVNFPISFEETENPNVDAAPICLDRNP